MKPIVVFLTLTLIACNDSTISSYDSSYNKDTAHYDKDTLPMEVAPGTSKIFFINLKKNQTITSRFEVTFGVDGIALDTVGKLVTASGHHTLMIDGGDSIPSGMIVIKDSTHIHFDSCQTQTHLVLLPGPHKLTLQYVDGFERSYGEKLAAHVDIRVK